MFCLLEEKEVEECCMDLKCAYFTPCYERVIKLVEEEAPENIEQMNEHADNGFQKVFEEEEYSVFNESEFDENMDGEDENSEDKSAKSKKVKEDKKDKEVKEKSNLDDLDLFL